MSAFVTEQQVESYRQDGVVLLRNVLDRHWLEILAEGIEQNLHEPSKRAVENVNDPASGAHFFYDARTYGELRAYDRVMMESPMAEVVAPLMGSSSAVLFYISVFVRRPGTRERTPWHQDKPSWSATGEHACSAWVALDSVPRETALEFIRGSHRWPDQFERPAFFQEGYANDDRRNQVPFPDIESERDRYDILGWDMNPGDCLVFHGLTVHGGSGDLPAGLGRRAVSVQWLGDDARFRLVPGGDDPRMGEELQRHGVEVGDPLICDMCPVVWPRA